MLRMSLPINGSFLSKRPFHWSLVTRIFVLTFVLIGLKDKAIDVETIVAYVKGVVVIALRLKFI